MPTCTDDTRNTIERNKRIAAAERHHMTLIIDQATLDEMERRYPGIGASIRSREEAVLPPCHHCGSADTAKVGVGAVGRTFCLATATTKFALIPNSPKPGEYRCNDCKKFFG